MSKTISELIIEKSELIIKKSELITENAKLKKQIKALSENRLSENNPCPALIAMRERIKNLEKQLKNHQNYERNTLLEE